MIDIDIFGTEVKSVSSEIVKFVDIYSVQGITDKFELPGSVFSPQFGQLFLLFAIDQLDNSLHLLFF